MAISSSKLVVPTVTNTDFMAAGRAGPGPPEGAVLPRTAPEMAAGLRGGTG